jgi:hypothetical protein
MFVIVRHRVDAKASPDDRLRRTIQYSATLEIDYRRLVLLDTRRSLSSGSPEARPGGGYDAVGRASLSSSLRVRCFANARNDGLG